MEKNLTVTKSNMLAEARFSLSLIEWRLLLIAVAKINTRDGEGVIIITGKEFSEWFDISLSNAYNQLREAVKALNKSAFKLKHNEEIPDMNWNWLAGTGDNRKKGQIGISFSEKAIPLVTGLSVEFTSYQLAQIAKLSLPAAMRLFEVLAQFKSKGYRVMLITDYRRMFDLKEGEFNKFADLRRKKIEPLVKEINIKIPSMNLEWKGVKRGRSFDKLEFTFTSFN